MVRLGNEYIEETERTIDIILRSKWLSYDCLLEILGSRILTLVDRYNFEQMIAWLRAVQKTIDIFRRGDRIERFSVVFSIKEYLDRYLGPKVTSESKGRVAISFSGCAECEIEGSKSDFLRLIANLVMNAKSAISATPTKEGNIDISVRCADNNVVLLVSDNGTGMPPEKIRHLMTKQDLGQAIHSVGFIFVRRTVERFGGVIEIESSKLAQGTIIKIVLPRKIALAEKTE